MCRELKGMKIYDSVAIKCGSVSYNDLHIYNITDDENEYMKIIFKELRCKRRFKWKKTATIFFHLLQYRPLELGQIKHVTSRVE